MDRNASSNEAAQAAAKRKMHDNSRRSKESRKGAGRHLSRQYNANTDLLDLGVQVGEQIPEDEASSAALSKRQQNQSMTDVNMHTLVLDQSEDLNQYRDDGANKSVLTPNMYGGKTRTKDGFISSNPYIKFKKEQFDPTSSVITVSGPGKSQRATHRKQTKIANGRFMQDIMQLQESMDDVTDGVAPNPRGEGDEHGAVEAARQQNQAHDKEATGALPQDSAQDSGTKQNNADKSNEIYDKNKGAEKTVSYVTSMNMQDQLDELLESSSSLIGSPGKSKRKKQRGTNQKSTRRYKSHKSPRKKRINGDLEDLGQDIQEEEYDDMEEGEGEEDEDANDDLIDPIVPEINNTNFEMQPSPKKAQLNNTTSPIIGNYSADKPQFGNHMTSQTKQAWPEQQENSQKKTIEY